MDYKMVWKALLFVTLFTALLFGIIIYYNKGFQNNTVRNSEIPKESKAEVKMLGDDLYGWMQDELFFDAEKIGDGKYSNINEEAVLNVSSVQKDLRVKVLNSNGNLIKGRIFTVNIPELGDYRDLDRDGYIYVPDVAPGIYNVGLKEIKGLQIPKDTVAVNVKADLEYKIIDDISLLIKDESEIDIEKDDTEELPNQANTGEEGIKEIDATEFGIDVSKYNKDIDWARVKNSGVDFAIIRCGYRGSESGYIVEDPKFKENIRKATDEGIKVGVYFFTQAVSEIEAVEEASAVISLIREYNILYPVFIDSEGAGGNGRADSLDVRTRSKNAEAFCETIRSAGYKAGIYASKNWFNGRLDITEFSEEDVIWLAEYKEQYTYGGRVDMWQYSSNGAIDGIDGRVDMNIYYK